MKELRSSASGDLRVLFAFDPRRTQILLIGGNKEGAQAPTEAPAGEAPAAEAAAPTKEAKLDGIKDILTQILGQLNGEKPTEKQAGSEEAPTGEVPAEEVPAEEVPAEGAPAEGINDKKDLIKELLSLIEGDLTAEKSGEGEVTGDPATVEAPAGDDKMSAVTDLLEQIKGKLGGEEGGKSEQFGGTNGSDIKKMFGIL